MSDDNEFMRNGDDMQTPREIFLAHMPDNEWGGLDWCSSPDDDYDVVAKYHHDTHVKALQQQNTALQQQGKDLQAEAGNIKAQGIKEACQYFKENSWDFGNHVVSVRDLKEYANTLFSKGGD